MTALTPEPMRQQTSGQYFLRTHPITFFHSAIAFGALPEAERKNIIARQLLPSETNIDAATTGARHTTNTVGFIEKINLVVNKAAESGVVVVLLPVHPQFCGCAASIKSVWKGCIKSWKAFCLPKTNDLLSLC